MRYCMRTGKLMAEASNNALLSVVHSIIDWTRPPHACTFSWSREASWGRRESIRRRLNGRLCCASELAS